MKQVMSFKINGMIFEEEIDHRRTLLEVLRENFGLLGTHKGCDEGQCGACTVLVNNKPTFACLTPIGNVAGQSLVTIEGLAKGDALHPVQAAFLAEGAFQCGYCSPGMILATVALLADTPRPTDEQIVAGLDGHLCRCCGYPKIIKAVRRAAGEPMP